MRASPQARTSPQVPASVNAGALSKCERPLNAGAPKTQRHGTAGAPPQDLVLFKFGRVRTPYTRVCAHGALSRIWHACHFLSFLLRMLKKLTDRTCWGKIGICRKKFVTRTTSRLRKNSISRIWGLYTLKVFGRLCFGVVIAVVIVFTSSMKVLLRQG